MKCYDKNGRMVYWPASAGNIKQVTYPVETYGLIRANHRH